MRVRVLWLILPALGGCFLLPSGDASRVEDVPADLGRPRLVPPSVPDRHPYGAIDGLEPGQWATYREGDRRVTIAAVAREGDAMWIEVIEEGEIRLASARLVGPDGVVRKAFYREISAEGRSTVEPQELVQSERKEPKRLTARGGRKEHMKVGDREVAVTEMTVTDVDLEGRMRRIKSFWSEEVPPVYAASAAGGLVSRHSVELNVDLTDFGSDAISLVEIPK